ncbi:MAG: NADH-quinone oxidoreductase subunit J [Pseudomonadota bacterium]
MAVLAAFYIFAAACVAGALMSVLSRDAAQGALWLAFTFATAAVLALLLGAEFVVILLILVHAAAIAILMTVAARQTDDLSDLVDGFAGAKTLAAALAFVVAMQWIVASTAPQFETVEGASDAVGAVLAGRFLILFPLAVIALVTVLVASIGLSLRETERTKRRPQHFAAYTTKFGRGL